MNLRTLARVVVYDKDNKKILLVKNKETNFWYAPGGGWEFEKENILECAKREVKEETGLEVEIAKLLYLQEFHATEDTIFFETFWLATPNSATELNENHIDIDPNGQVEQAKWFGKDELQDLKIFPKRLKNTFWDNINILFQSENPFIGVS
ncbi:MAG: NUDIX hydrolase [Patescibacteria group bacterium]